MQNPCKDIEFKSFSGPQNLKHKLKNKVHGPKEKYLIKALFINGIVNFNEESKEG